METEIQMDFDATYAVKGYDGIAFRLHGYAEEMLDEQWTFLGGDPDEESNYVLEEPTWASDESRVQAIMVGDNRVHIVEVDDLTKLGEGAFCRECGQIGCSHG